MGQVHEAVRELLEGLYKRWHSVLPLNSRGGSPLNCFLHITSHCCDMPEDKDIFGSPWVTGLFTINVPLLGDLRDCKEKFETIGAFNTPPFQYINLVAKNGYRKTSLRRKAKMIETRVVTQPTLKDIWKNRGRASMVRVEMQYNGDLFTWSWMDHTFVVTGALSHWPIWRTYGFVRQ